MQGLCPPGRVVLLVVLCLAGSSLQAQTTPSIFPGGIVNGATFAAGAPLTVGSIASIFGTNLADPSTPKAGVSATTVPLPTTLGGAIVRVNTISAPLFYVSAGQINFQIPDAVGNVSEAIINVVVSGTMSNIVPVSLQTSPGIFEVSTDHKGAVLLANTASLAHPAGAFPGSKPALAGTYISIFCTGLGPVDSTTSQTKTVPKVLIGSDKQSAQNIWSGIAPGFVGLNQINAMIPATSQTGAAVALTVTMDVTQTDGSVRTVNSNAVAIAIDPGGVITLDKTSLAFSAPLGGGDPPSQSVTVTNSGVSTTTLTPAVAIPASCGWLKANPASLGPLVGGQGGSFALSVQTAGLASGTYNCTVSVAESRASNSPQTVAVTLDVPSPSCAVNPTSLVFGTATGLTPPNQSFTISNTGGGLCSGSVTASTSSGGNWLSVSPASFSNLSGSTTATVTVTAALAGLVVGEYSGTITVTPGGASQKTIPVILRIGTAAAACSPNPLDFPNGAGSQTVTCSYYGSGTLSVNIACATDKGGNWLSASPTSLSGLTSGGQPVTIATNVSGLLSDQYTGRCTVTDASGVVAAHTITVTMTVPPALISATPGSLSFTAPAGGGNPAPQTLTVSNIGNGMMDVTAKAAVTTPAGGSWLSVSTAPVTGLIRGKSGTLTVSVTVGTLASGIYSGTITLSGTSNARTVVVPVSLTVPAPVIKLSSTSFSFSVASSQTVTISNTGGGLLSGTLTASTTSGGTWLSVSPSSFSNLTGSTAATITVSANLTGLAMGAYTGAITVRSTDAGVASQTISVTLTVPNAKLQASPATLSFSYSTGGSLPASQTITVTNAGGLTLSGTVAASANWLSVDRSSFGPLASGARATVAVSVNVTGLPAGTQTGTITITAPGADSSPQTVAVTLVISTH